MATEIIMFFHCTTGVDQPATTSRTGGWSERLWHSANDYDTVIAALQPSGPEADDSVWAYRLKLLPSDAKLLGFRLQAYELSGGANLPVGGSKSVALGYNGTSTAGATDTPGLSAELRMRFNGHTNATTLRVGCIPDNVVVGGEITATSRRFDTSLNAYINRLAGRFGSVIEDFSSNAPQKILRVTPAAGNVATVAGLLGLTGFTVGSLAVVRRSRDGCKRGRGGRFRVTALPGGTGVTLHAWPWGATTSGTIFPLNRVFATYSTASQWQQCVLRKVGRPFDLFVGRRPARR